MFDNSTSTSFYLTKLIPEYQMSSSVILSIFQQLTAIITESLPIKIPQLGFIYFCFRRKSSRTLRQSISTEQFFFCTIFSSFCPSKKHKNRFLIIKTKLDNKLPNLIPFFNLILICISLILNHKAC
jgi:hypothetical protein